MKLTARSTRKVYITVKKGDILYSEVTLIQGENDTNQCISIG